MRSVWALANAIGRLVEAGHELSNFSGTVARLDNFLTVLDDVASRRFVRPRPIADAGELVVEPSAESIVFEKVRLETPTGDVLATNVSFEVKRGVHAVVSGPNGSGKSSLFRCLAGLWPAAAGRIVRPSGRCLFLPQRPYLSSGTLRDELIYPDRFARIDDDALLALMADVKLEHLLDAGRHSLDSVEDWNDVLSGGEKQRVALVRLFYHKPVFGVLDECTSAVSADVEAHLYERAREHGITLFTICHRRSVWRHHSRVIEFDPRAQSVSIRDIKEEDYA